MRKTREAAIFVHRGGRFLIGKRTADGYWNVIAGQIEDGESFEVGAARELFEETGLVTSLTPIGAPRPYEVEPESRHLYTSGEYTVVVQAYVAEAPSGWEPRLDHEHSEARWCTPDEAGALLHWPEVRAGLTEAATALGVSPWCWMCDRDAAASPRASEHVFPRWLVRRIPRRELTVGEICLACNSGWMSRLEVVFRAAMFTRPRRGVLSATTQLGIARWFAKTAVLIDVAEHGGTAVPAGVRHALARGLPESFDVLLARHAGPGRRLEQRIVRQGGDVVCAVRLGDLVGVAHHRLPRPRARPRRPLLRIGPAQHRRLTWDQLPTVRSLDEAVRQRA